ncbi:uncharacterized protein UV8b_03266 [Ustilaginoidea virens]|uniref:Uncharacterized protein n=1 Tax=Ustilaginoidea virens TaxID=1159556 RepID=A0A8E5HP20_USTVR|nr:uncharacterized protein UV8b_03266 [Ustilaginoidea virens]QUC19025.1 hypothetical protein UV8b_03266 [Ustilaginoidea virens]
MVRTSADAVAGSLSRAPTISSAQNGRVLPHSPLDRPAWRHHGTPKRGLPGRNWLDASSAAGFQSQKLEQTVGTLTHGVMQPIRFTLPVWQIRLAPVTGTGTSSSPKHLLAASDEAAAAASLSNPNRWLTGLQSGVGTQA